MVKAMLEENKDLSAKNLLHTPKDGFIQKKKNQKFKQTPTGKVALINGSRTPNNSSMKQENLGKQKSTTPQKSPGKNKEQKTKDSSKADKKQQRSSKTEPNEKIIKSEEDESESDEDINEGIVLEEQSFVQESNDSEDEDESDEDESEEEKNVLNILGTSLADDSDEDDDDYDYEEEEDEKEQIQIKKGVQMFKGLKANSKNSTSTKDSADKLNTEISTSDDDEEEEDIDRDDSGKDIESEDDEEESDDDEEESDDEEEEESEDEEEGDESILGLKALLGNSIADDDDDDDFFEPGEEDEDDSDEVEDEEEEEEDEEMNNSSLTNSQKEDREAPLEELKMDKKTIFVGNLPKEVTKKQLKKEFKKFGHIETIRLRGIVAKSMNVPKKVAAITNELHPRLKTVYAYIRFDSEDFANAALSMNGKVFQGNYLRVDTACKSDGKPNLKKSVFLGNLHFNIDDNTVRKHFEGCGEIESVRVIRDNKTGVGKGFGYVNFKTEDAAALALELDGTKIANREVKVKPCTEQDKKKKGKHGKRSLSAEDGCDGLSKKMKNNAEIAVSARNKDNAMKRINEKKQKFGKQTSPQQANTFQGQKADGNKKKGKNKLEKKKKILADKLAAKSKKPTN